MKLLLDENLSPKVAEVLAREDGLDACHVRDRGLLGGTDAQVLERAFVEDRIFVTKNVLIERGDLTRDEQLALMRTIIVRLRGVDLINQVLRVPEDGSMTIEPMPASE